MSECDFDNCREPSTVRVTYGLYEAFRRGRPHHVLRLCQTHSRELWEKCKNPVTVGIMHYVCEEPK